MSDFKADDYLKSQQEEINSRRNKPKKVLNIDGEEGTFDTGAYAISRKSTTAVTKPSGMPKGKVFKNNGDFVV